MDPSVLFKETNILHDLKPEWIVPLPIIDELIQIVNVTNAFETIIITL